MSFRVPSPAAAAELQNHDTRIDFAILKAAWRKRPDGTFLTSRPLTVLLRRAVKPVVGADHLHEPPCRGRRRRIAARAQHDAARRDLLGQMQLAHDAAVQAGERQLLRHARHAEADARQRDEQVVAGQLDLRLQAQTPLQEAVLQEAARACLALEQDEQIGRASCRERV